MPTDEALMQAVRQGDEEAFALLVSAHRAGAESYAASILGDFKSAEDVVQDCFVKVYVLRERYRDGFSFQAYLHTLIRHRCIDLMRKRGKHRLLSYDMLNEPATDSTPEAAYLSAEYRLRLAYAIGQLTPEEQRLLLGRAYEAKSYRELAGELRLSAAQVKIKLHRIRKKLKAVKEDEDESLY